MEPGSLVLEDGTVVPPDPAELVLRDLYGTPTGMRLSMIRAADGSSVGVDGTSRSLNGPEDLRILRVTRSLADLILVGAATARSESYRDIRLPPELVAQRGSPPPDLAIVTRSGVVPDGLDPERTWIYTTENAPAANAGGPLADRTVIVGSDQFDAASMVEHLGVMGYRSFVCEGGPQLAKALLAHNVIADFCITTSPKASGDGPKVPPVPEGARLAHTLTGNGYVMERWLS